MNQSHWELIAGKTCKCGRWATHFYNAEPICCACHGGENITEEQAKKEHYRIILERDDRFHALLSEKLNKM